MQNLLGEYNSVNAVLIEKNKALDGNEEKCLQ